MVTREWGKVEFPVDWVVLAVKKTTKIDTHFLIGMRDKEQQKKVRKWPKVRIKCLGGGSAKEKSICSSSVSASKITCTRSTLYSAGEKQVLGNTPQWNNHDDYFGSVAQSLNNSEEVPINQKTRCIKALIVCRRDQLHPSPPHPNTDMRIFAAE